MVTRNQLLNHLEQCLQPSRFDDYAPNGLQVAGRDEINTLVTGVTACQALIDAAVALSADAILVHHGWFWRGEAAAVVGMKQRRLRTLLRHDINLIGYHLPLDDHPQLGNNAGLGAALGLLPATGRFGKMDLGWYSELAIPLPASTLYQRIEQQLQRSPLHISAVDDRPLQRIGWCSGGADNYIEAAVALGLDAFISGEISEPVVHIARECGIDYFAAGHHATERFGVRALGAHLAQELGLSHHFVDIANPV